LPRALPDDSVASLSESDSAQAREDYRFVLERLGPCERTGATAGRPVSGDGGPG